MVPFLPPLRLTNASVLRDAEMQHRSVGLAEGIIVDDPLHEVDLTGYMILPGIIDLHGDGFERHMHPRPSAPFPPHAGLESVDREAAAHGVTTAYLAQGWSWEGAHRSPETAIGLAEALSVYRPAALTDLRIQIRAETGLVREGARLIETVAKYGIDYVVFNDHLAEGFDMAREAPADFAAWAKRIGKTPDQLLAVMLDAEDQSVKVPRHLSRLSEAFNEMGVHYGSHDDPNPETREQFSLLGARIAEFPLNRETASAAHSKGCPVLMGAPNVVRGGSQAGNVAACELIAEGVCDALVSDYHLPALPLAAWTLVDRGLATLPRAWAMISTRPADILRLRDRGRIEPGLRADLVIVNALTRAIEATITGGRLTHLSGEAGCRFVSAPLRERLAAE